MITIYWCCKLCSTCGHEDIKIYQCSPADPLDSEIIDAQADAFNRIQAAHNSGGCPGELFKVPLYTKH